MRHLYSNQCHDEAEVWCGDPDYFKQVDGAWVEPTRDPPPATCKACLAAAAEYGSRAAARLRELNEAS